MPNYIPSGGIENGEIIYDNHIYNIIGALKGASGSDIHMGVGILFVSSSQNVGINTLTPSPSYKLVVNGNQLNTGKIVISGSGAELYINNLITSSTATNFVTYNTTTGKLFTTSSGILDQYLLISQSGSML